MMEERLELEFKTPYFYDEEEIRGELINTIFEGYYIDLWNCRHHDCPDPYFEGGYPFIPRTGDILYREVDTLKLLELKFPVLHTKKVTKKQYKGMRIRSLLPIRVYLDQLNVLETGHLILIVIAEFVTEDIKKLQGVSKGYREREVIEAEIQIIRDYFGQDEILYSYLIITQENYDRYSDYFRGLKKYYDEQKRKEYITASFNELYFKYTLPEERFSAVRSNITSEIAARIFSKYHRT